MNEKSRKNEHGCVFSLREIVGWDLRLVVVCRTLVFPGSAKEDDRDG